MHKNTDYMYTLAIELFRIRPYVKDDDPYYNLFITLINNQLNSVCHITKDKITYDDAWHYIFEYIAEGTKQEFILCPVLTRDAIKLNNEKPVLDVASLQYEINKHGEPSIRLENITWEVNKEIVNFLKQYLNISIIFTENEDLFRFNVNYNPV